MCHSMFKGITSFAVAVLYLRRKWRVSALFTEAVLASESRLVTGRTFDRFFPYFRIVYGFTTRSAKNFKTRSRTTICVYSEMFHKNSAERVLLLFYPLVTLHYNWIFFDNEVYVYSVSLFTPRTFCISRKITR